VLSIKPDELRSLSERIFAAAGTPREVADYMAQSLVTANLMGHDSHGVIRIPRYIEQVRDGSLKPAATPSIVKETETTALVDGNFTFGQVAARFATDVAVAKAKRYHTAAVGLVKQNHTGRIGEFAEMMGRAGLFGMFITAGSRQWQGVAPHGGRKRVFGTNPFAFAVPAGKRPMMVIDWATSVLAEGKLQVARAKKAALPPGVILDGEGKPSTDVEDFYTNGGVMLPFAAYKGYSLALLGEILVAPFLASDVYGPGPRAYGSFVVAVNVEAFRPVAEFTPQLDALLDEIKAVPPAQGFDEVLIPGEPEQRTLAQRRQGGIPMPEETWQKLLETAKELGIDPAPQGV
jgi:LDH2 family malate/lactate/ureidoglycolate dehydrogenase